MVEIGKGSKVKYELDKSSGLIKVGLFSFSYLIIVLFSYRDNINCLCISPVEMFGPTIFGSFRIQ